MTRKHFELIARAIAKVGSHTPDNENFREGWESAIYCIVRQFAHECSQQNPRFDRKRFFKACGYPNDV